MSDLNSIYFNDYLDSISPILSSSPMSFNYKIIYKKDKMKPRLQNILLTGFLIFIFICLISYILKRIFKINVFC